MFKRKINIFIAIFLVVITLNIISLAVETEEETDYVWLQEEILETSLNNIKEPNIYSKCAVVLDRNSKTVLWGKNENTKVPMASTTKVMTT